MEILLALCYALLTIPQFHSASTLPPPSMPILSIPLYHKRMINDTIMSSGRVHDPQDVYHVVDAYAIFLLIGTPVQIVFLRVDTGSPMSWFQCDPACISCYPTQRPLFNTRASSTYKELACYSDTCSIPMMRDVLGNCGGWKCRYNVRSSYNGSSRSFGVMFTDTLNFDHSEMEAVKNFIMGCGDSYEGPFRTQFSGVLGLGRGPLSVQNQLKAKAFSFCLDGSHKPSSLEFYEAPPLQYGSNSVMVPLTENSAYPYYYFLQFVGIGVNGFMLDIPSRVWGYGLNYDGGVIIDIGATLTYLPSDAYSVFRSEIQRIDHNLTKKPGYEGLEFCYKDDNSNVYPTIELYFENGNVAGENFVSYRLSKDQILFKAEEGTICLSFAEGKSSALTLIGSNQLQGTLLTYDLINEILVFSYSKC